MECVTGTDDIFADSSTETIKENKSYNGLSYTNDGLNVHDGLKHGLILCEGNCTSNTESMTNGSVIAIRVMEDYCKPFYKVYCPFCSMSYTTEHDLKNHLRDSHKPHLNLILSDENPSITFQSCTLCHAKFYMKGLLPLHLLKTHENALIGLINCRNVKHDEFLYCMYCHFTVLKSNSKALMLHLEKMHFPQFEKFICDNYSITVNAKEVLNTLQDKSKFVHYSSSLNRRGRRVSFSSRGMNSSARRKLDFNNIEVKRIKKIKFRIFKKEKSNVDSSISICRMRNKEKKKLSKWLSFGKVHKKAIHLVTSTPKPDQIFTHDEDESSTFEFMQFRCASCHQTFRTNTNLLNHVSHFHKWPWNRLRPCYSCGFCDARFYRNSFLVRHTLNHHTPKCLRSDMDD